MRLVALGVLSVVLAAAPSGLSQSGWVLGTEDLPELPDAADDVEYDPLYLGSRHHAYIDLVAAWFTHDNSTDRVTLHLKVADARALESDLSGWWPSCRVAGTLTHDGGVLATLSYSWYQYPNGTRVHGVTYDPGDSAPAWGSMQSRSLEHGFTADLGRPGYFRFDVDRLVLLQVGDAFEDPDGLCRELYAPHAGNGGIGPGLAPIYQNTDEARSEAAYSFAELRRTRSPDGVYDPIERLPAEGAATESPPAEDSRTLGFGAAAAAMALAGAAAWVPRRR